MKRAFEVALGILTAIGGFVEIGELITGALVGARFGMRLAWATVLSLLVIMVFAEMAGRVAAVSQRPVFSVVREQLGPRLALVNLLASFVLTAATVAAEIGGVALALELATSINYLLWVPIVGFLVWVVVWRVRFDVMENVFGLLGLALVVAAVAVWQLGPDWGEVGRQVVHSGIPAEEGWGTYLYYAIAMFGAGVMPYEVFFFSSGAVEEGWTRRDLSVARANVFIGFPLGTLLTLSITLMAALVFAPQHIEVASLYQTALPVSLAVGRWGLILAILGFFACTFGAALECTLSCGYSVAQYFGWQWGKTVQPADDARFHVTIILTLIGTTALMLTSVDPLKITEFVVVLSAAALPLTYIPVLIAANDRAAMGAKANSRLSNVLGGIFLVLLVVVSLVTIPLMILTRAGG